MNADRFLFLAMGVIITVTFTLMALPFLIFGVGP